MNKRIVIVLIFFLLGANFAFGIQTYLSIRIDTLKDSSTNSCINLATNDPKGVLVNYGPQGRIRALSSILPDYPIFFKITDLSDGSIVWQGNSSEDIDYHLGELINIPTELDLSPGKDYELFFDIDAIKVYLPLRDYQEFVSTSDNLYWTVGYEGTGTANEYGLTSSTSQDCSYYSTTNSDQSALKAFSSNRSLVSDSCWNDAIDYNCDEKGMIGVLDMRPGCCWMGFRTRTSYNGLYNDNIGNFKLLFRI